GTPGGVFKSTNGGSTWNNTGTLGEVYALVIDPETTGTVYAGTHGGVSKTTDGGSTWSNAILSAAVYALAIDPTKPGTVFAGTNGNGVFKSADSGDIWNALNMGL